MTIVIEKYVRKPFHVEGLQVTEENIAEVAQWCNGRIQFATNPRGTKEKYIAVSVVRPLNERQTKAFTGDWILYTKQGYKVYTDHAFNGNFDKASDDLALEPEYVISEPCD